MFRTFNFSLIALFSLTAQDSSIDFRKTLLDVQTKPKAAKTYEFEGELALEGQKGSAPAKLLSKAKMKLAVAPKGKYLLRVEPAGNDDYLLVSDGDKTWAYVPKLKQYIPDSRQIGRNGESRQHRWHSRREVRRQETEMAGTARAFKAG